MPNVDNIDYTQKVYSGRVKADVHNFVGQSGRLFYNESTGEIRISDGVTPYGLPIFSSSTGSLLYYAEPNGTPDNRPRTTSPGAIAVGDGALSELPGAFIQSSGVFSQPGDAQVGSYISRIITSDSSYHEMFLDGISAKLSIQPNTSMAFTATIIAKRIDSYNSEGAVYEVKGGIDRSSTVVSTRLIGTPSKTVISEDNPSWGILVSSDSTNGALVFKAKGENGKTIRWVAHIKTVEVRM